MAVQLDPDKMVNAFAPIGAMVLVNTRLGEMVNAMKTRNKMLPLHVHTYPSLSVFVVDRPLF